MSSATLLSGRALCGGRRRPAGGLRSPEHVDDLAGRRRPRGEVEQRRPVGPDDRGLHDRGEIERGSEGKRAPPSPPPPERGRSSRQGTRASSSRAVRWRRASLPVPSSSPAPAPATPAPPPAAADRSARGPTPPAPRRCPRSPRPVAGSRGRGRHVFHVGLAKLVAATRTSAANTTRVGPANCTPTVFSTHAQVRRSPCAPSSSAGAGLRGVNASRSARAAGALSVRELLLELDTLLATGADPRAGWDD